MILIIIIILAKTCLTQSAPASSWVTPSPEEGASSPSKFVFLSSGFVEMFSLCQKKSPLKNVSFLPHPSLYLFLIRHISFSWELPLFAWVSKWYHDTIMFTYNMFKIAISQKPASITFVFSLQLLPAAKIHIFSTSNPRSLISEYFRLIWYLWSGNRFTRSKQIGVTRARWSGNHTLPDILQHFEDVKTLF